MKISARSIFLTLTLLISFTLFAGGKSDEEVTAGKETYFVSIVPQAFLLERVAGDRIDVEIMVPPGKSPAIYEPTPQQMVELGEAAAFFTIGVPFENTFLHTVEDSLPKLPLVDAAEGIERRHLETHDHDEEHEAEGEHEEDENDHEDGALDPHVWMSPVLMKTIASNMADYLTKEDREGKSTYETNLNALLSDLDYLDKELAEILAPLKGETLFVYHPGFGYFADRYGMHQEAIEVGGKEPSPADLERIIHKAQEEGVHVIIVQPEFSQSSAEAVARAIGGAVVPVAPLHKDYINNLKSLAMTLKESLQ